MTRLWTSHRKDTELVALGVCQDNPRLITLTNVDAPCAVRHKALHLRGLVLGSEVEMQSALSPSALIKPDEVQPRQAIRLRSDLELLCRGADDNPTKGLGPPLPESRRISRMNNHLLPLQGHPPRLTSRQGALARMTTATGW